MSNRQTIGFSAGFLAPYNASGFAPAERVVTGKISGQTIRLQGVDLASVWWWTGRMVRVLVQCTGLGAIILYGIELYIAHLDVPPTGMSIPRALIFIAHWVPVVQSKASTDAKARLTTICDTMPAIHLGGRQITCPLPPPTPEEPVQVAETPPVKSPDNSSKAVPDGKPQPAETPPVKSPDDSSKAVPDGEPQSAETPPEPPVGPQAKTEPQNYFLRLLLPDGKMIFSGNNVVTSLDELPGPASLKFDGNVVPKRLHIPEKTKNVECITCTCCERWLEDVIIEDNKFNRIELFYCAPKQITLDCSIDFLEVRLSGANSGACTTLNFGNKAHVGAVKVKKLRPLKKIKITNGVGVENAIKLLKAATRLERAELLFTNLTDDQWRTVLAAATNDCKISAPDCPPGIKKEFTNLVFEL
ncbi:MAG: hypothetical protein LBB26_00370 [Puniceicoccales bacterium]|nr:hypothetical protein [Puniceicoccales bacterium]